MKFENIINEIGDEGRFQKLLIVFLLAPAAFFNSFYESVLLMTTPDHWCEVPELESLQILEQKELISPLDPKTGKHMNCFRYDLDYSSITNGTALEAFRLNLNQSDLSQIKHVHCKSYAFDKSIYSETITTQFGLVCKNDYMVNTIISISFVGLAFLTPFLSTLSDRYGRRYILLLTLILAIISSLLPILVQNFYIFAFSRFLAGGVLNVYFQIPFVMVQEVVSESWRTRTSLIAALLYSFGICSQPIVVKYSRNWINFSLVTFIVSLPLLICFKLIPESPTWLISTKQLKRAEHELRRICRINKRPIPTDLSEKIASLSDDKNEVNDDKIWTLFTRPGIRYKTLCITIGFSACVIGYAGILLNTINDEAEDQLYNFFFLSVSEIPALVIGYFLVNSRFGRRWTNVLGLFVCSFFTIVTIFIPLQYPLIRSILPALGKFGISITFMVIYQHSSELYPTTLRSQGMGVSSSIAAIVSIFLPQLVYLNKIGEWIPYFTIGSVAFVGAVVVSFLPETLNQFLPQNGEQASKFGHKNGYFSLAPIECNEIDAKITQGSLNSSPNERFNMVES